MIQRIADIRIVGDRTHQRHAAGVARGDALVDKCGGIHQQARGYALVQTVPLEIARNLAYLHQTTRRLGINPGFLADDRHFERAGG